MLFSVHLADLSARDALSVLGAQRRLRDAPGLVFGVAMLAVPLRSSSGPPLPDPHRVGVIAAWRDGDSHERFLAENPIAARLAGGFRVALEPLRVWGAWPDAGPIPAGDHADGDAPVAAITLGRLRLRRAVPFLAASGGAERGALAHPGLLAATAFSRPPRLVSTFSLWRDATAVRDYATGGSPAGHRDAMAAHGRRPFHHESVFVRLRPLARHGRWDGRDPLCPTT
jgi:hypothetical protein